MSVKHIKDYYNQVCDNYKEAVEEIRDFEEEVNNNIIPPERIENLKNVLQPLLTNYQQLSYIMFLLNMPNKKEKEMRYKQQHKKFLSQIAKENTSEELLKENQEVLKKLKEI